MMPSLTSEMREAISNVLETMFYFVPSFLEHQQGQSRQMDSLSLGAAITITGAHHCLKIELMSTHAFARIITANFLGIGEDEVNQEEAGDALNELLNMVSGDFLTRLPGDNWVLGVPAILPKGRAASGSQHPDGSVIAVYSDDALMAAVGISDEGPGKSC
jgi:CheY-specific phosphatase CheX